MSLQLQFLGFFLVKSGRKLHRFAKLQNTVGLLSKFVQLKLASVELVLNCGATWYPDRYQRLVKSILQMDEINQFINVSTVIQKEK